MSKYIELAKKIKALAEKGIDKLLNFLNIMKTIEEIANELFPNDQEKRSAFIQGYEYFQNLKQENTFENLVQPVMMYLRKEHHPHTMIQINSCFAHIYEGQKSHINNGKD